METGSNIVFHVGGGGPEKVRITANGEVGIGTPTPAEKLDVNGNVIADDHLFHSSKRWKTNIKPISDALDKVQRLRGVAYDWKADGKHDIGLIAEEVGEVIPEIVVYEENGVDAKSVAYARLVALLIEGMKEQQKQIDTLKIKNAALEETQTQFSSALQKLEALVAVQKSVNGNAIWTQGE